MMDRHAFSTDTAQGLREHDQAMLEQLLLGLSGPARMHVVLSSSWRPVLERYRQVLVERLRQSGAVRIETFLSSNTEQLVSRFNALVGAMPLQQALDREAASASMPTVFVVHDTPLVQQHELRLLAQLARDFPGANVRVLLAADPDMDVSARVQALGKNQVLHWAIEPPSSVSPARAEPREEVIDEDDGEDEPADTRPRENWAPSREPRPVTSLSTTGSSGRTLGPSQRALRRAAVAFLIGMLGLYVVVALVTGGKADTPAPAAPKPVAEQLPAPTGAPTPAPTPLVAATPAATANP